MARPCPLCLYRYERTSAICIAGNTHLLRFTQSCANVCIRRFPQTIRAILSKFRLNLEFLKYKIILYHIYYVYTTLTSIKYEKLTNIDNDIKIFCAMYLLTLATFKKVFSKFDHREFIEKNRQNFKNFTIPKRS